MESSEFAAEIRANITDDKAKSLDYFGPEVSLPKDKGTSHASFFGPDGDVIAISSTVND